MPVAQPTAPTPTAEQAVAWLSRHRYDKYLSLANDDHELAMKIYLWNSDLSSAILRDLGHLEVAVRNAFDEQLCKADPDWAAKSSPAWLLLETGPERVRKDQRNLNNSSRILLGKAQRDLGPGMTHGKVIARLSFGFWQFLTVKKREATLWTRYLHKAFPKGTARSEVHSLLDSAVGLRNRLAHMEPVSGSSAILASKLADVDRLFALVSPEVHDWITGESNVVDLIRQAPVPGLI
jgi:hypothetical protein